MGCILKTSKESITEKTREKFSRNREAKVERHRDLKETGLLRDHEVHKQYRDVGCYNMGNIER